MDISIGTGLAVASVCFTFIGVFYRVIPRKNGDFNREACIEKHKAIDDKFEGFENWMARIEGKLDKAIANKN